MAIHTPGKRHRYSKLLSKKSGKRGVTAELSLTAMVDMFTVLVVFLLQNFGADAGVLYMPSEVELPKAESIKNMKPSVVVSISPKQIFVDEIPVFTFAALKAQNEWLIEPLKAQVIEALKKAKEKQETETQSKLRTMLNAGKETPQDDVNAWNKVTVQADKGMDFLTVKKVMYTVTEAGAGEINFAVLKEKIK